MISKALFARSRPVTGHPNPGEQLHRQTVYASLRDFLGEREEAESSGAGHNLRGHLDPRTAIDTERPEPQIPLAQPLLYLLCYNSASSTRDEVNDGKSR